MAKWKISRNVFFLGLVSLFTDLSSEMIYPLIPEFLTNLGANKFIIGVIEGVVEAVASGFRTIFGRVSDKMRNRKLFIFIGYGLSSFSKPLLFFAGIWQTVFLVRVADRLGKAIRTPARDALISTSIDPADKGKAFGYHRAMDRIGAIGGPALAMLILFLSGNNVRLVFLLSVIPGILSVIFINFAKETKKAASSKTVTGKKTTNLRDRAFIIFFISVVVFTLGNSSNAFLILKAQETGLSLKLVPLIWVFYNIFCTVSAPIFGILSDHMGPRPVIIASFIYYALVYALFAFSESIWQMWVLFAAYGIYFGLTDGVFRAYIADLVEEDNRATAYGIFNTGIGLALLPASMLFGWVWDVFGSKYAFLMSSVFSLLGFLIFIIGLNAGKMKKSKTVF